MASIIEEMKKIRLDDDEVKRFSLDNCLKLIVEGSVRLKCSMMTRLKALMLYHQFKDLALGVKYDDYLVAAACLSLSIKFSGQEVELDAIIFAFYSIIENPLTSTTTDSKIVKQMRKSLTDLEVIILRVTEFYLKPHLAHEYLLYFLNDLRENMIQVNVWDVLTEASMKLASDFYFSNKCLVHNPEEIALAVLYAALYLVGINITRDCYLETWLKALANVPETKIFEIIEDIFMLCSVGQVAERQKVVKETIRRKPI